MWVGGLIGVEALMWVGVVQLGWKMCGTHSDVGDINKANVLVAVLSDLLLLSHPSALVLGGGLDETETSGLGGTGRRNGGNEAGRAGEEGEEGRGTHVVG